MRAGHQRTPAPLHRLLACAGVLLVGLLASVLLGVGAAQAAPGDPVTPADPAATMPAPVPSVAPVPDGTTLTQPTSPTGPRGPKGPTGPSGGVGDPSGTVNVDIGGLTDKPSTSVTVIIALTLLSLAPAILLTCTSFTKILVVLGLTRNALGLQQTPPNQVLAGLALFLSLFVMAPVLSAINSQGVQPYLHGTKTSAAAWHDGIEPLRGFMLKQTDAKEIQLLTDVAHREQPAAPSAVPLSTLVPAFILSELKQAFIIGFIVFIPFLVIDIVVSGALMALGMMMMPPVMVSLPFKLLLFVMVDGWGLVIKSLVASYGGG
ncbi:MAG: flagellar type III secretion system pore protein FliP [Marmoricola sp.]